MKKLIIWTLNTLATLNLIDMCITLYLVSLFGTFVEANPVMKVMLDISPILFFLFKTMMSVVLFYIAEQKDRIHNWMIITALPTLAYVGVVGWGLYVLVNTL